MAQDSLQKIRSDLEAATPQLPLATTFQDIVPGEGTAPAELLFIGEAPGSEEAKQRRPFVGKSGQLLRTTLVELKIDLATAYVTNIVKVRPPDNRDPSSQEIAAFKPFLDREIKVVKPQLVVTLGRLSMAKFLPNVKISHVHGQLHKVLWDGELLFVVPMYHPAAALRSTQVRQSFVSDFAKIEDIRTWIISHHPD